MNKYEFHETKFNIKNSSETEILKKYIEKYNPEVIECSVKINEKTTEYSRTNFWFNTSENSIRKIIGFFKEFQTIFNIDKNNIKKIFIETNKDCKIEQICVGIDSRNNEKSRLKLWFTCKNYAEILKKILDKYPSENFKSIIISNKLLFGYDFYKNEKTEYKIYPKYFPEDIEFLENNNIITKKTKIFLQNAQRFYTTHRTDTNKKILHIRPIDEESLIKKINNNKLKEIYTSIKEYPGKKRILISINQQEIEENKFSNINIYY
ncbi:hypothetical protein JXM83_06195 [Candidatus Woesearchaeota archaeon]|nr:hypothetical protein [Candidatus Woesearchaeota archaeon]